MSRNHDSMNPQPLIPHLRIAGGVVRGSSESALALAARLAVLGELAVTDLDGGANAALVQEVIVRCGGGVRVGGVVGVEAALRWLNAGATKVAVGADEAAAVAAALPEGAAARLVAAVAAGGGAVAAIEGVAAAGGVGGVLLEFEEGAANDAAQVAAAAAACAGAQLQLTVAGAAVSAEDVAANDRLGVETQACVPILDGSLGLGEALGATLVSDRKDGLFSTLVTDEVGVALGLCYSSKESLVEALNSRRGVYQSRSRGLWVKGLTSGATQDLLQVSVDCDRDCLRFTVFQNGSGFCHQDTRTCFGPAHGIGDLFRTVAERKKNAPEGSYTKRLFEDGALLESKLLEEARELAAAATREEAAWEAADVLYFAAVFCAKHGVSLVDVEANLARKSRRVQRRKGNAKPAWWDPKQQSPPEQMGGLSIREHRDKIAAETLAANAGAAAPPPFAMKRVAADELTCILEDPVDAGALKDATAIMTDIRARGEAAVIDHAVRLGDMPADASPVVGREELKAAFDSLPVEEQETLRRTADRVKKFAEAQRSSLSEVSITVPGGEAGHTVEAVENAGCYAPGGRYPLPSSVVMTAVTARVAGCKNVWVASPRPAPATLAAAYVSDADGLLRVGGAQAIGALAYGLGDKMPACDAVVGPGNKWVTAAKSLVAGRVAIDMLAGASECLAFADDSADAATVAADLIAQAEHDVAARAILVTTSEQLAAQVDVEIAKQLLDLPTAVTARPALTSAGYCVVVPTIDEGMRVCDVLAPEHLELHLNDADATSCAQRLKNYGGLFVGHNAAEVLGDYGAGPNHTLPTGGTARSTGGLCVLTFLRVRTWLRIDELASAQQLVGDSYRLAQMEGLHGHSRAAFARIIDK